MDRVKQKLTTGLFVP